MDERSGAKKNESADIGELVELVKGYVRQETIGPLKGIGRKIAIGLAGAVLLSLGVFFLALGLLRVIQDQIPRLASGSLSWISYLIVLAFCLAATGLAIRRITKTEKELN